MRKVISTVLLVLFFAFSSESAERIRIGIVGFDSKASGVSQEQATVISDLFTRALASSKTISVFERERLAKIGEEIKLGMSGLVDMNTAVEVGKIAGLQYMIMGSVTELSEKVSGGAIPLFSGVAIGGGSHEARATIDIRVVDVSTSEIILAISESGTSTNSAGAVSIMGFSYAESEFGGLQARAIADAVQRLSHAIRSNVGGENSHVLSIGAEGVIIDIGSTMGSKEGHLYLVYADGKTVLGMNGEVIGRERLPIAVLKVKDISISHSTCTVAPPSDAKLVKRGDKIEPVSAAKAKSLKFITSRPATSSGTLEALLASDKPATDTAPTSSPMPQPQPQQKPAPAKIDGFDPNKSDEQRVIQTYGLDHGTTNTLGIRHLNAMRKFNSGKYKDALAEFSVLFGEHSNIHYLAAYWAGVSAQKLKKNDESLEWINKALAINPKYEPALTFKTKTLKK